VGKVILASMCKDDQETLRPKSYLLGVGLQEKEIKKSYGRDLHGEILFCSELSIKKVRSN